MRVVRPVFRWGSLSCGRSFMRAVSHDSNLSHKVSTFSAVYAAMGGRGTYQPCKHERYNLSIRETIDLPPCLVQSPGPSDWKARNKREIYYSPRSHPANGASRSLNLIH